MAKSDDTFENKFVWIGGKKNDSRKPNGWVKVTMEFPDQSREEFESFQASFTEAMVTVFEGWREISSAAAREEIGEGTGAKK